ncbi:hypothetical protein ACFFX1_37005 [Dactylosporangium sucinum]|uniref:Uncharacterized protein n=1 Tax=Dactylosporangium sucinum TaxID=1424081 RepID=A0A917TSU9_9ACTN|nr:hypothetical protein [Dactylosporangium sucinum]GGM36582.1 hypothetical protein GCM10007977_042580 [Dactylosporangium sucinum]
MNLLVALAIERNGQVRDLVLGAHGDRARLLKVLVGSEVHAEVETRIADLVEASRAAIADVPISPSWQEELAAMTRQITTGTGEPMTLLEKIEGPKTSSGGLIDEYSQAV